MSKKVFSWVQPHYRQGAKIFNNYYLPYSAGILWTYVQQFEHLRDQYTLGEVIWKREPINDVLDRLKDSDIVGFSTYIWNNEYNTFVARELKKINPNVYIIFGGPQPSHSDPKVFEKNPYMDCIVTKEGEVVLKEVLENMHDIEKMKTVKGIILNYNGEAIDTGDAERIHDLDSVPSPYLSGFFDKMMADNPDHNWSVVFEPDRGCPYQCTYCDWGSMTYSKIKKYNLQRLFDEIEWFAKNKVKMIMVANANFGIFPARDHQIADKFLEVREKYGYPVSMYISWAKNQKREVINIAKKLHNLTGLTVSIQTLTDDVLKNIKRDNLPMNDTEEIFKLCHLQNVPVHTELILGLPGESLESWKETIYKLFKAGNHTSISFYTAQILENSELNRLQRKLYDIKSIPVKDFMAGEEIEEEIKEIVHAIVSTKHLPLDKMQEALMFNLYINTFHVTGITTFAARFLHKYLGEEYSTFYEKLYDYLMQDPWFKNEIEEAKIYYERWTKDGAIKHPNIGESIEVSGLNLHYRIAINIYHQSERLRPHVQKLVNTFIKETYQIDNNILEELFKLQDLYWIDFPERNNYPKEVEFNYDFVNYLLVDAQLENKVKYKFEYRGFANETREVFCELIYYARRGQFTKARITTIGQQGDFEY